MNVHNVMKLDKVPKYLDASIGAYTASKLLFRDAAAKWPDKRLGLVGIDRQTGKIYFQEWGNPIPFVLDRLPADWDGPRFTRGD
jgi:hypothetical protein